MNQRQVLELASKIVSLYFLTSAVGALRDIILYAGMKGISSYDNPFGLWVMFGSLIINFITNMLFFWFLAVKSKALTKFIYGKNTDEGKLSLGIDKKDLLEISIVVIGIIAITFSLPNILHLVADSIYIQRNPGNFTQYQTPYSDFLYSSFKVIVGILVVIYARTLTKIIIRIGEKDDSYDKVVE